MSNTYTRPGEAFHRSNFCKVYMPYCIVKLRQPGHVWLPLNRDYKPIPLGKLPKEVPYGAFAEQAVVFARNPQTFKDVFTARDVAPPRMWLYDGNPETWATYLERLARLFGHSHTVLGGQPHYEPSWLEHTDDMGAVP